jgi:hypothetical protein
MWCDRCRADAAAEVSAETGRAACATCGNDLGAIRRPATEQARDLLKKWSAGIDLESASEALVAGEADESEGLTGHLEPRHAGSKVRMRRPAAPIATQGPARMRIDPAPASTAHAPERRIDAPRSSAAAPPHFDVHTAVATRSERSGHGAQIVGQILAYAGVLALTIGTALVIWGYFGGPPDYAPTGWLVATGGQMLLFLGVVTLVAGGLEQTSRDVRVRVESLGERLIRIEQVAAGHAIKGPHSAPGSFAGQQSAVRHGRERV